MKKLLVPVIMIGASIILAVYITRSIVMTQVENKAGFNAAVLAMKMEFMSNNAILRKIDDSQGRPDLQKYLLDVNNLAAWYHKKVAAKVWEQYPDRNDPESVIKEKRRLAEVEGTSQRTAKSNLPIRNESYELARNIYDAFQQGNYKALASDYQGSVRMDIHKIVKDGNKLQWQVLVWGGIGQI